jgi:hypothetical protein
MLQKKIDHSLVGCGWSCFNLTIYEGNTVLLETYSTTDFSVKMKRMRTTADSDSATSNSDVENSYNTDNEVETESASESDSDNADDTSSEVGDEYESDPWAPLKAEATQQG